MRLAALVLLIAGFASARDLQIYAIDVEGGKSTLYVSTSGESMLIDAGYDGFEGRDTNRILAAVKAAGVKRIDHFVLTHYHGDHAGGVKQLAARIRIDRFYDHGPVVDPTVKANADAWDAVHQGRHVVLKPGDTIPVKGMDVRVVASHGNAIAHPTCGTVGRPATESGENAHSLAMIVSYGKFRISDLGDLSADREFDLGCPGGPLGRVDLFMSTHHGTRDSVPPQILTSLAPRAVLMNNGFNKGGSVTSLEASRAKVGPENLWQLHYSQAGGEKLNAPEKLIANMDEKCTGMGIRVIARKDGQFTLRNERNRFEKTYPAIN